MPVFSIIIPVYNAELFLEDCLESIRQQIYRDFEVIMVNDGSTDNSPSICERYALHDSRFRVINKSNGGASSARICGTANSTGNYIVCIDADDWISSDYLCQFYEYIERFSPDVLCCGSVEVNPKENIVCPINYPDGYYSSSRIKESIYPSLIEGADCKVFPPSLWAKAIKREIFQKRQNSVNCDIIVGEDDACIKPCIADANSLYILSDCLYYYRYNSTSITKSGKARNWNEPKLIAMHFQKSIGGVVDDLYDQINRNITHRLFNVAASQFNRNEKYLKIRKDIVLHLKDPFYVEAVRNSFFRKSLKGKLAYFALRFRWVFLLYLYYRV